MPFGIMPALPVLTYAASELGARTQQTITLGMAVDALDTGTGVGVLPIITVAAVVGLAALVYRRFRR